jgi:DNA-binding SARP family transcriptional activator
VAATGLIRLLGRPAADGVQVRGNKPWAIAAYLTLAGRPVTRERLISLLFADADDPANALRWNLTQVRRLLRRPDDLRGEVITLTRGQPRIDVEVLTAGRWQEAVELPTIGAELLEGMAFPSCAAFETWLLGERRRLGAITESVLYEACLSAMSRGQFVEAIRLANLLVTLNPLTDSHQELLIRAFAISGDAAAARRQLVTAVRVFRRDLGCDPQPSVFLAAEASPARSTVGPSPARVRALLDAGQAQVVAGAIPAAIQVLRTACDEAARTGDTALEATAQHALGAALIEAGTPHRQDGELALQRAIDLARRSQQPAIAASAYRQLAGSDALRGIYPRAEHRLAAAEAIQPPTASERVEVAAIRGVCILDQGDVTGAIDVFAAGIADDPDRSHPFLPIMLAHAGRAQLCSGDIPAARRHLDSSLQIAQARAWAGVTAAPLALLGHASLASGDPDTARFQLEEAFARACQVADPCWETWAAHGLGLHSAASGDLDTALDHLADAVHRSRPQRGGHLWSRAWALTDAARIARRADDPRAVLWRDEALATTQRCGMRALTGRILEDETLFPRR